MINAHRIVYNNLSSDEFDVIPGLSFSGDDGATESFLGREGVYTEHYDGHRTIHRAKYNEAFTPRFTLIKKDYGDFDANENRKILSWLTSSDKPGWLEVYKDDSNVLEWRVFGCITSIEQYKLGNGRIVGYEFEIESSHPYAWSNKIVYPEVHHTIAEIGNNDETNDYLQVYGTQPFTITCNTDEYNKPVYPRITVTFKGKNENIFFPISVNPLQENTYPMVPNVIYSWEKEDKTHLFVNLNGTKHNGRYAVQVLSSDTEASSNTLKYGYYYFPADNAIKTTVETGDNEKPYEWESVALIGMAVRIQNTYISDGMPITKEAIIAGGTMDEVVILDGTNKLISGTKGTTARIIGDDFNWEWLPLAYGENKITVSGNCTIKFEWLEPRKVGSL